MSEWQPIETAPKDRSVLLYGPEGGLDSGHLVFRRLGHQSANIRRPNRSADHKQMIARIVILSAAYLMLPVLGDVLAVTFLAWDRLT